LSTINQTYQTQPNEIQSSITRLNDLQRRNVSDEQARQVQHSGHHLDQGLDEDHAIISTIKTDNGLSDSLWPAKTRIWSNNAIPISVLLMVRLADTTAPENLTGMSDAYMML
jgi:hypothetical protein